MQTQGIAQVYTVIFNKVARVYPRSCHQFDHRLRIVWRKLWLLPTFNLDFAGKMPQHAAVFISLVRYEQEWDQFPTKRPTWVKENNKSKIINYRENQQPLSQALNGHIYYIFLLIRLKKKEYLREYCVIAYNTVSNNLRATPYVEYATNLSCFWLGL